MYCTTGDFITQDTVSHQIFPSDMLCNLVVYTVLYLQILKGTCKNKSCTYTVFLSLILLQKAYTNIENLHDQQMKEIQSLITVLTVLCGKVPRQKGARTKPGSDNLATLKVL